MKRTWTTSIKSYPPLFVTSLNATFSSSEESWMLKYRKQWIHALILVFRKGKLLTYTNAKNTKAQIVYNLINKKWINSALNCEAYSSFEGVSFNQRILTAKIRLTLYRNATWTTIDIVCVLEYRYHHSELEMKYHDTVNGWIFISVSARRNSVNAAVEGVGMPFSRNAAVPA